MRFLGAEVAAAGAPAPPVGSLGTTGSAGAAAGRIVFTPRLRGAAFTGVAALAGGIGRMISAAWSSRNRLTNP